MINWDRVAELREEVGEEDFEEVVELFLDEVDAEVDNLCNDQDATALASLLHFLKGSALNLGFQEFSDLCSAGERRAGQCDAGDIDVDAIRLCYQASRAEFVSRLKQTRAA